MPETPEPIIYQLKVVLLGISPMIWRRLLVFGDSTTADLNYILQIAMGWPDDHLHRFRIHGKQYGIARLGGLTFNDDSDTAQLKDFRFRINERFLNEYDFIDDWWHQIRVEAKGGATEAVRNIVCQERGSLRPAGLGMTLVETTPNDIGHIRPPKAKAALITFVPDGFQLFKMVLDVAVICACLGLARSINLLCIYI